jgi:hypothetical protein
MNKSPFRPAIFGDAQLKLSQLASSDAESLHSRAEYVAPGRYRSLFETHLETAMMFLNKAIAFDGVVERPISAAEQKELFNPTEENESG